MITVGRPSPAFVVASLALFVSLGGTSYAVSQAAPNSVGTRAIKADAVTTAKVKNGSLRAGDFAAGQLPRGAKGPAGQMGPQGQQGQQGQQGPAGTVGGPAGGSLAGTYPNPTIGSGAVGSAQIANNNVTSVDLGDVVTRSSNYQVNSNNVAVNLDASCLPGEELLGGGGGFDDSGPGGFLVSSQRVGVTQTWRVRAISGAGSGIFQTVQVDAICLL